MLLLIARPILPPRSIEPKQILKGGQPVSEQAFRVAQQLFLLVVAKHHPQVAIEQGNTTWKIIDHRLHQANTFVQRFDIRTYAAKRCGEITRTGGGCRPRSLRPVNRIHLPFALQLSRLLPELDTVTYIWINLNKEPSRSGLRRRFTGRREGDALSINSADVIGHDPPHKGNRHAYKHGGRYAPIMALPRYLRQLRRARPISVEPASTCSLRRTAIQLVPMGSAAGGKSLIHVNADRAFTVMVICNRRQNFRVLKMALSTTSRSVGVVPATGMIWVHLGQCAGYFV